jgi:hypothetical protein
VMIFRIAMSIPEAFAFSTGRSDIAPVGSAMQSWQQVLPGQEDNGR